MEGSGVIDLQRLATYKTSFAFFSRHLIYPDKIDFHPSLLEEAFDENHPSIFSIQTYWSLMYQYSLDEIQEMYTATFDFEKNNTLFMTYHKFEDGKERGQMLAQIKAIYEMFELDMETTELSDYLPLICEFFYVANWDQKPWSTKFLGLLLAVLEDGTFHLSQSLKKQESPYYYLIQGLRECFKSCIQVEASNHERT